MCELTLIPPASRVPRPFNKTVHAEHLPSLLTRTSDLLFSCGCGCCWLESDLSLQVEWEPHTVGPAFPTAARHNGKVPESHGRQEPSPHGQRESRREVYGLHLPLLQGERDSSAGSPVSRPTTFPSDTGE